MKARMLLKLIISVILFTPVVASANDNTAVSKLEIYKQLFNIASKAECKKNKACNMLKKHIVRDSNSCQMDPEQVEIVNHEVNQTFEDKLNIKGSIRYVNVVPGKYRYDVYSNNDAITEIRARIYIKNKDEFSEAQINSFRRKINEASKIWTNGNRYSFPINFNFDITDDKNEATVKIKLVKDWTRGPYFKKWSLSWTSRTMAHEFGHVLGLDDEYSNRIGGGSDKKCNRSSLMCSSGSGSPWKYHYYLILRRILCSDSK